jgi:hypothetical protein
MKRIFLSLLLIFISLIYLTGCSGNTIDDFTIDFKNSNSIVVKKNETPSQIFKCFDENGKAFLLDMGQGDEIKGSFMIMVHDFIELPEEITDFEIIGYSDVNVYNTCDILIYTNDGVYLICPNIHQWVGNKYDIYKVENETCINKEIKNIVYKSNDNDLNRPRYFNNILKFSSINNDENNINFVKKDQELTLLENVQLSNAFFLLAIDDESLMEGYQYNNIIILDTNNNVYYYSISPDLEIIIEKKMGYDRPIVNYGVIINEYSNIHIGVNNPFDEEYPELNRNYFYILTENELFIYDKLGELFHSIQIENEVYGINFVNFPSKFEIQLAFKTEEGLFRWEKKTVEREEKNEE